MNMRGIVAYLDYKTKREAQELLWQSWVCETLSGGKVSYMEKYNNLWGLHKQKQKVKSADEVIADTLKKHNIKIKGKSTE